MDFETHHLPPAIYIRGNQVVQLKLLRVTSTSKEQSNIVKVSNTRPFFHFHFILRFSYIMQPFLIHAISVKAEKRLKLHVLYEYK